MPVNNAHLTRAHSNRDDEFYTRLEDIEAEMAHHRDYLRGRSVWCNCDDPERSQFVAYFRREFDNIGLRRLVATGYDLQTGDSVGWCSDAGTLECDGDFRRNHKLFDDCDAVITNPPFQLLRENLGTARRAGCDVMLLGGLTLVSRPDMFPLIRDRIIVVGGSVNKFETPKGGRAVQARWYGSLPNVGRNDGLEINCMRDPLMHPRYDEYPAIDVPRVSDIPADWEGEMGVPISFVLHWLPEQFAVTGIMNVSGFAPAGWVEGDKKFVRLLIKHVDSAKETDRLLSLRKAAAERDADVAARHKKLATQKALL